MRKAVIRFIVFKRAFFTRVPKIVLKFYLSTPELYFWQRPRLYLDSPRNKSVSVCLSFSRSSSILYRCVYLSVHQIIFLAASPIISISRNTASCVFMSSTNLSYTIFVKLIILLQASSISSRNFSSTRHISHSPQCLFEYVLSLYFSLPLL